jgi:hypothetical protein
MTATDTVLDIIRTVHREAAGWYPGHVDPDDLYQELAIYATERRSQFEKWVEGEEPHRVTLALRSVARIYGATEKAQGQSGFEYEDVAWYSPDGLATVIPLALDDGWDGLTGESGEAGMPSAGTSAAEGGTLLAMVLDVRRVWDRDGNRHVTYDPETDEGVANLVWLAEALGGQYPSAPGYSRGRRKCISNGQALKITKENE